MRGSFCTVLYSCPYSAAVVGCDGVTHGTFRTSCVLIAVNGCEYQLDRHEGCGVRKTLYGFVGCWASDEGLPPVGCAGSSSDRGCLRSAGAGLQLAMHPTNTLHSACDALYRVMVYLDAAATVSVSDFLSWVEWLCCQVGGVTASVCMSHGGTQLGLKSRCS